MINFNLDISKVTDIKLRESLKLDNRKLPDIKNAVTSSDEKKQSISEPVNGANLIRRTFRSPYINIGDSLLGNMKVAGVNKSPLSQFLKKANQITDTSMLKFMYQIALALKDIHENGYIHGNLTPEVITIDEIQGRTKALITDPGYMIPVAENDSVDLKTLGPLGHGGIGNPYYRDVYSQSSKTEEVKRIIGKNTKKTTPASIQKKSDIVSFAHIFLKYFGVAARFPVNRMGALQHRIEIGKDGFKFDQYFKQSKKNIDLRLINELDKKLVNNDLWKSVKSLLESCVDENPDNRPSSSELVTKLDQLCKDRNIKIKKRNYSNNHKFQVIDKSNENIEEYFKRILQNDARAKQAAKIYELCRDELRPKYHEAQSINKELAPYEQRCLAEDLTEREAKRQTVKIISRLSSIKDPELKEEYFNKYIEYKSLSKNLNDQNFLAKLLKLSSKSFFALNPEESEFGFVGIFSFGFNTDSIDAIEGHNLKNKQLNESLLKQDLEQNIKTLKYFQKLVTLYDRIQEQNPNEDSNKIAGNIKEEFIESHFSSDDFKIGGSFPIDKALQQLDEEITENP